VTRSRLLPLIGLVAIALVTALAVVGVTVYADGDDSGSVVRIPDEVEPGAGVAPPEGGLSEEGIEARGSVAPRNILFGDTIRASVDVVLDRRKVDPDTVRVSTQFVPWEIVGVPLRTRSDAGQTTHLRTVFTLRCTSSPCLPTNNASALEFGAGRLSYAKPADVPGARKSMPIDWPLLLVASRFAAANAEGLGASDALWRADLASFPAASYRISPTLLVRVLVALAVLLTLGGVALAFVAIPRRRPEPEPEPEPDPEPLPLLTPLEQALELLEDASRADGAEDRRRALELVAEVLDLGHPDLARAARTLAWSEDDPLVEQTSGLATRVRTHIDMSDNGNGRVH
jgi:hypothetical protein